MAKETEDREFADRVKQRMREIDEASERFRREHREEEPAKTAQASAPGADEPQDDEDASIAKWEGAMRRHAEENGGLVTTELSGVFEERRRQVRLTDEGANTPKGGNPSAPSGAPSGVPSDTETLLNGLIAECRSLLRDVAFRSACLTPDADERIRFLTAGQNLATTGANVGKVVARLRRPAASAMEERRHHFTYEHTQTSAPPPSPRVMCREAENEDQSLASRASLATKDRKPLRKSQCAQDRRA